MTVGAMSVDDEDGPNFFARFDKSDDAPFEEVTVYCSGDKDEDPGPRPEVVHPMSRIQPIQPGRCTSKTTVFHQECS